MANIRAQVILHYFTGLPEDVATNTLYFQVPGSLATHAADIVTKISTAYLAFDQYLAESLLEDVEIKLYDMADPPPRQPYLPGWSFALGARVDGGLPEECSVCLSFRGDAPYTARRRGRIYIGPLSEATCVQATSGSFSTVNPPFIAALQAAAAILMDDSDGILWCVYSPTGGTYTIVTNGWVDNTFDTQRRRGVEATARNVW
jgi:hypothetical protein